MKSTLMFCAAFLVLLGSTVITSGNIAPPRVAPSPEVKGKSIRSSLVVAPDGNAWDARLQISRDSLRQLRAALDNLPAEDSTGGQTSAGNSTRTIMAGLFMFLAVSFAGVWLARSSHGRTQKAVAGLVMAGALVGATAMITRGNAAPPPGLKWRELSKNLNSGVETRGSVEIEIVPDGRGVKLIVPLYGLNAGADKKPGE